MKHAKRDLVCLLLLLGVMAIHSRSWGEIRSLVMISDMDRNWKSDGVQQSGMNADEANVIKAKWAEHLLQATLLAGRRNGKDASPPIPGARGSEDSPL